MTSHPSFLASRALLPLLASLLVSGCGGLPLMPPDQIQALPKTMPGLKAVQRLEAAPRASKADLAALEEAPETRPRSRSTVGCAITFRAR